MSFAYTMRLNHDEKEESNGGCLASFVIEWFDVLAFSFLHCFQKKSIYSSLTTCHGMQYEIRVGEQFRIRYEVG